VIERPGVETSEIAREWQKRTGQIEGATELEFSGSEALGDGFQLQLLSKDPELLRQASAELHGFLAGIDEISNIRDKM
jgi:hypothetical protein